MQRYRGSIPAIATPMTGSDVDLDSLAAMVEWLIEETSDGIVACGTTGEGATLTPEETLSVVARVVDVARGRVPVIAGTGSNDTRRTVELTRKVSELGADAALIVTPYYNKPTREGLYLHYRKVAEDGGLPVLMYNVPGRTALSMDLETIVRCAGIPGIVGLKDASTDMALALRVRELTPPGFSLLSGDDFTILPFLACGGDGVITVVGNLAPRTTADLVRAFESGEIERARELQGRLLPLAEALFVETSPVPLKAALHLMGRCQSELRLPLTEASEPTRAALSLAMSRLGILPPDPDGAAQ